ncbi:MAG TPA: metal ABC transporter substrate-binding protein [Thermoanaerobaculia bacterium]|nr:metal ABC transporter substrate-binding protein [Thermoanaerobaculia bacterium]
MRKRSLTREHTGALAVTALILAACNEADRPAAEVDAPPRAEPLLVAATSPLGAWLAQNIGGDDVRLSDAVPTDVDHHGFQPSAEQIVALGEAVLIVLQGASYEAWRDAASLPESRVVDLSAGLDLIQIEGRTHSHGAEGEHSHTGVDPATWTDPALVAAQAQRLLAAMEDASPERAAGFLDRSHALETELDRLVARVAELSEGVGAEEVALAGVSGRYAYLARALRVDLFDLPLEPDDHDLQHLRRAAGARRLIVLVPAAPAAALRAKLPGATWVELDPLEQDGPDGYAYLERMNENLDRLAAVLTR